MPSVAVIGTRGYPSYYGGFETAVRKLAPYLVQCGWDVTVYGRKGATKSQDPSAELRVLTRITPGVETKNLSTLSYGFTATASASILKPDVALVMNVANGYFLPMLRARSIPTLVNVDGIEWERAKWSPLARRAFRGGAQCTARWANELVFDARAIELYWRREFGVGGTFIPYGGDVPDSTEVPMGLPHRGYVLVVARFVPENSVPEFFAAVPKIAASHPVVIVGTSGYGGELDEKAQGLANEHSNVSWLGHISDDDLLVGLWQHAGVYFHGHSVGGTNPALVQAMAAGAPIVARDTVYNREVLGDNGTYVPPDADQIAGAIVSLMSDSSQLVEDSRRNVLRAVEEYSWRNVCAAYEASLSRLVRDT